MSIELCLNIGVLELSVATFTYADGRRALLYDPQFSLLHDCSLAHQAEGVMSVEIKRHRYQSGP
jgi:hypothetical protein